MGAPAMPSFRRPMLNDEEPAMLIHLETQADLDDAVHKLVDQDRRLRPILEATGMPAIRQREPRFACALRASRP